MTYKTLISTGNNGGCCVTITAGATEDSILINDFWSSGISVKAKVDFTAKTIEIPSQVIYTHTTYGEMSLCLCNSDGTPDRKSKIVGTINDDGTLSITSWWGVFVDSGTYADKFVSANYTTEFELANGTMSYKRLVVSTTPFSYDDVSYGVVVKQTASNLLTVKNFANYGQTVEILLNRDNTGTIKSQLARKDATNGDWYTYAMTYNEETGKLTGYSANITTTAATDSRAISWTNWTLLNTGTTKYYSGLYVEGKVTTDFDITYPKLSVSEFEGEGTEASPYLIKTLDDLILLSDKVAAVNEFPCTTPPSTSTYARIFKDTYFRLENDIDMSDYRFTPIGADWQHIFAGTFDGNNHKITGLNVSADGYAALFGRTDTVSVIKNLTIDKPVVTGGGYYAAAIAAWSLGTIENCHVTNANIYNAGSGAACIVAVVNNITNCTATNSTVKGDLGYVASIAGQVSGKMDNCHATAMKIVVGGTVAGYPSGGLVGSIFKGTVTNSYFSGSVDCASNYAKDQIIGGVAGTAYLATIDKCFSVGSLYGYYSKARVGGVIGNLNGSKLTNCYAVGRVQDNSARATGGITGYVTSYVESNTKVVTESEIKSCYTATQMKAETYQYKPETEVRESLGQIADGSSPTIENIYFDKNLTNFTSTHYGATTAELTSASGPTGFDASVWSFTEGQYPVLKGFENVEAAKFASSALLFAEGSTLNKVAANITIKSLGNTKYYLYKAGQLSTEGNYCKINGNTLEIGENFGTDTLFVANGADSYYWFLKIAPISFDGEGTELNPFLIKTKDDLMKLGEYTTTAKQLFPDTYFKMANDIDLELDQNFLGICGDYNDAANKFEGVFDGGGYAIHKMYIGGVEWKIKPEDSADGYGTPSTTGTNKSHGWNGFIGRLGASGVVKNLSIASDCKFEGWGTVGSVVADNYGLVDNCRNYADVKGYSCWVGGIVGENEKDAIVSNCYNEGTVTSGYFSVGGIVGSNTGTIENCLNVGDVEANYISRFTTASKIKRAGGITGGVAAGTVIKNVVNAGRVFSMTGYAGGIVPALSNISEISNAVNYGVVYNNDATTLGAMAGENTTDEDAVSNNNYWDAQIVALAAAGNKDFKGMTGAETSTLTSGKALDGFSTDIWQFDAGQYPVLKQFANEPLISVARKVIVSIPSGVTAKDLSADATLNTANGETWTLTQGTVFTIDGNTLKVPASVTGVVADTLIATSGKYVKPIAIKRMPVIPLTGSGTEADPYIISNADEWNALAAYMEAATENLTGKFVQIAADIDFTTTPLVSLCNNGVVYFDATMDGNNKKLSGIALTTANSYQGVFGTIGENGTVKDLTLAGTISSAFTYTGGFVGSLYGTLDNCVSELDITSTKSSVAGFVGYANSGAVLNKCINKGKVSGSNTNIAGIVASGAANVTYTDCGNEGTIENTSKSSSYTAGIVGTSLASSFTRCYNTGKVVITNNTAVANVAGLVAYANGDADNTVYTLTDCYNKADIDAKGVVAGVVAAVGKTYPTLKMTGCYNEGDITASATKATSSSPTAGISAFYTPGSTFENCWNTGTVMSQYNVYTAGITAFNQGKPTEETPVQVKNCYNTGNIIASGNQGGGIIAYGIDFTTVDSCYNTGAIEGGFGIGGIVGYFNGANSVISNCWNSGNVTSSKYQVGGIYGRSASYQALVENCFNVGNVASTSELGGVYSSKNLSADCIGGVAGNGGSHFVNCYNAGTVTGLSRVGGIVGATIKDKTMLTGCYNIGKLVAPADTCGALIGSRTTENPKSWTENNAVTDCYYVTDRYDYGTNNAFGTAKTVAELAALDMGEAWTSADNYSMPVLKTLNNEAAKAYSAAVVPAEGDTYAKITKSFYVGAPEGVTWTSSKGELTITGNEADFDSQTTSGEVTLTATCGDYSCTWVVTLDGFVSSLNGLNAAGKNIVSSTFFTPDGRLTAKPSGKDGKVYIVKVTYDDGSHKTVKLMNK